MDLNDKSKIKSTKRIHPMALVDPGGFKDTTDERDYPYEAFVGFGVEDIPDKLDVEESYSHIPDIFQELTLACGGYAVEFYSALLNFIDTGEMVELSPRSVYAFTHLPGGGSITRDNVLRVVDVGIAPETAFPTSPVTESHLQSQEGWNATVEALARRYKGRIATTMLDRTNFDLFCNAIYNGHGVVSGVNLSSEGWRSYPIRPPREGEKIVGHILYFKGYDVTDPDPSKHYIIAKDSYPSGDKKLYRDYFEAGMVHSAWTIIDEPNEENMWTKSDVITAFWKVMVLFGHAPLNSADLAIHNKAQTPNEFVGGLLSYLTNWKATSGPNVVDFKEKLIKWIKEN